ncbi:hypothetical protein DCCM_2395 [Desulfocucumis palustris]|uniref:Uncharacterized protein n=1 Tax=Desulfocucumis palustris TaxID=1898651 RepID=A0A2L2XGE9_9FIRM|nr:hypothetical protein DCCM_2395 [Desulfocucumis palustris]
MTAFNISGALQAGPFFTGLSMTFIVSRLRIFFGEKVGLFRGNDIIHQYGLG